MKTIICDMDSIIVDLLNPWIAWYNSWWHDNLSVDKMTGYHIEEFIKPECGNRIYEPFGYPGWYENLPPLAGAYDGLKYLYDKGHDIVIATAVAGRTADAKYDWLKRCAPFIKKKNVLIGSRKELIKGDVFIDDSPDNIRNYRNAWSGAHILTIAYPYNRDSVNYINLRAHSYKNTQSAWKDIVAYVDAMQ